MTEAPRTVWVTKYALTRGIAECEVVDAPDWTHIVWVLWPNEPYATSTTTTERHPTREAALARAEEMRAAKIASLKRQIERLESLEF